MKKLFSIIIMIVMMVMLVTVAEGKRRETLRIMGGSSVPRYGLAIDASYDPRFDNFVEGYKVVQVAIINNSFNMIPLDPKKDRWAVHAGRKRYSAVADLMVEDRKAWSTLDKKAQELIAYPLILPIGVRHVFDLFVPDSAPLDELKRVDIDIHSMDTKFEVIAQN